MNSLRRTSLVLVIAAAIGVLALAGGMLAGSGAAEAQLAEPATFTLHAPASASDDAPAVVTVSLDPGTSQIAAVSAAVDFDASAVQAISCEVTFTGVCNIIDGQVRFAGLSVNGFAAEQVLVTEFVSITGGSSELALGVRTASDVRGIPLDDVVTGGASLDFAAADGSITGEVIDAATGDGFYNADVCAGRDDRAPVCTTVTALGTYRLDGLTTGTYTVVVSDPAGVATSVSQLVAVTSPEISTGIDAVLAVVAAPADVDPVDAEPQQADGGDEVAIAIAVEPVGASIVGQVLDAGTNEPVFGIQVCAVQPLVLNEACGYTNVDGTFQLADLNAGNYVVTAVDPAQRYLDAEAEQAVGITDALGAFVELSVDRG